VKSLVLRKLLRPRIWSRILKERLAEPLHLQLFSLLVAMFGSLRTRIEHDLIIRQHNAYSILRCADMARLQGIETVSLIEFGVAAGAGLMNMARIAERVTAVTGVRFKLYGFDTGKGMPQAVDYRDHPDLYRPGDFPMNFDALRAKLPANVQLIIGDVSNTLGDFLRGLPASEPIGYVVLDVDYYSSSVEALKVFDSPDPNKYLPVTLTFLDDIDHERHNSWCGELLAVSEFNAQHAHRKLERFAFLSSSRFYKNAPWIKHIFSLHVLDHPHRAQPIYSITRALENPYL
jgi:hypothetical protein